MSCENSPILSKKTYARSIEPVMKIGYMDGVSDGQTSVFQQSFDVGYEQGFNFGLYLGFNDASKSVEQKERRQVPLKDMFLDPQKINCQICLNNSQENIDNLYNTQKKNNLAAMECK